MELADEVGLLGPSVGSTHQPESPLNWDPKSQISSQQQQENMRQRKVGKFQFDIKR